MPSAGSADMGSVIPSPRTWVPGWLSRVRGRRPNLAERDLTRMEGQKQPVETDRHRRPASHRQQVHQNSEGEIPGVCWRCIICAQPPMNTASLVSVQVTPPPLADGETDPGEAGTRRGSKSLEGLASPLTCLSESPSVW